MDQQTLNKKLINVYYVSPKTVGPKRLLFRKLYDTTWVPEIIQPSESIKLWEGGLDDLMMAVAEWSQMDRLWGFSVLSIDAAFHNIAPPFKVDYMEYFSASLGSLTQAAPGEATISQIGLTNETIDWLLLFETNPGLEIAFYGPTAQADALLAALATPTKNRALDRMKKLHGEATIRRSARAPIIIKQALDQLKTSESPQQLKDIITTVLQAYIEIEIQEPVFDDERNLLKELQAIAQQTLL